MVNYQLGKIYRIVNNTLGLIYYGSTTEKALSQRLAKHKANYKSYLDGKGHFITSFTLFENEDHYIELVEKYPCDSKDELHARERFYIQNNECVNKVIPTRTKKEWYEENKDTIAECNKQYYEDNKKDLLEYQKQYRAGNKIKIAEWKNQYYEDNKKVLLEYQKQYRADNKVKIAEYKKQYHQRKKA